MTHPLFGLSNASEETLGILLLGGIGSGLALAIGVLVIVWRNKSPVLSKAGTKRPISKKTSKARGRAHR